MTNLTYNNKEALTQLAQGCELGKAAQLTVIADATLALLLIAPLQANATKEQAVAHKRHKKQAVGDIVRTVIASNVYQKTNAYELAATASRVIHYHYDDALSIVAGEPTIKASRNALMELLNSFTDNGTIARADKAAPNGRWMLPNLALLPADEEKRQIKEAIATANAAKAQAQAATATEQAKVSAPAENSENSEKSEPLPTAINHYSNAMASLEKAAMSASNLGADDYKHLSQEFARWFYAMSEHNRAIIADEQRPMLDLLEAGERYLQQSGVLEQAA